MTAPPDAAWSALADGDWRALAPGLAVALGCGLLIGLERERRKRRRGPAGAQAAAGIRTFAVAALAGALAQALEQPWLVAVGAALVAALVALAYRFGRQAAAGTPGDDPGLTTELALLATYLIGVLAMRVPTLAAAVAVVLAVLLAARERLHRFATTLLSEAELRDALLVAALALVLLPLVPAAPAPWLAGIAPRSLLLLLLLILLLQAAGHVALRWLGPRTGLALAGLASGFVSSTATVASMGAGAREVPAEVPSRAAGAIFSALATWVQALAMMAMLAPEAAQALAVPALCAAAVTLGAGLLVLRQGDAGAAPQVGPHARQPGRPGGAHGHDTGDGAGDGTGGHRSGRPGLAAGGQRGPLRLREAALVALALAVIAMGVGWAQQAFGSSGRLVGTALAALADAHAAVGAQAALHAAGRIDTPAAVDAALLAIGVNSVSRGVLAFAVGGGGYGVRVAATLAAGIAAAAAALVLVR